MENVYLVKREFLLVSSLAQHGRQEQALAALRVPMPHPVAHLAHMQGAASLLAGIDADDFGGRADGDFIAPAVRGWTFADDAGKRLAKRDDARALSKYRAEGATPADIRRMVGL